jgi:hypothetical protein
LQFHNLAAATAARQRCNKTRKETMESVATTTDAILQDNDDASGTDALERSQKNEVQPKNDDYQDERH